MNRTILIISTLLIISCIDKNPATEFSLSGTTNGLPDGTILYLGDLDSTTIENSSFNFRTQLSASPIKVRLHTGDNSQYRFLWLENKSMHIDASATDLRHAIVTGSDTENLSQSLHNEIDSLPREARLQKEIEFVRNNPSSIVSANIL